MRSEGIYNIKRLHAPLVYVPLARFDGELRLPQIHGVTLATVRSQECTPPASPRVGIM